MKQSRPQPDATPTKLTVQVPAHIARDFQAMEKHTKKSVDELVTIALKMFIATHNDYLGRTRS